MIKGLFWRRYDTSAWQCAVSAADAESLRFGKWVKCERADGTYVLGKINGPAQPISEEGTKFDGMVAYDILTGRRLDGARPPGFKTTAVKMGHRKLQCRDDECLLIDTTELSESLPDKICEEGDVVHVAYEVDRGSAGRMRDHVLGKKADPEDCAYWREGPVFENGGTGVEVPYGLRVLAAAAIAAQQPHKKSRSYDKTGGQSL